MRAVTERVCTVAAADGRQTDTPGAYKTVEDDNNSHQLSDNLIQLVSIGTERKETYRSETDTMSGRTPGLTWTLPPILKLAQTEIVGPSTGRPNTARQNWQVLSDRPSLEERPGVDVDKPQCRRGLLPVHHKGEPPYSVDEYIRRGNELGLLYSKIFAFMPVGGCDTTLVRVRGGSRRVTTRTGGWRVGWKHWTVIPKSSVFDVRVDLFCARQPQ